MKNIRERCAAVVAEVMEIEPTQVNDASSPDTLEQWNSLSHVQMVLKFEKEFGIKISPEEGIEHFNDFKSILAYIQQKAG
jgi:acyl carrier protein